MKYFKRAFKYSPVVLVVAAGSANANIITAELVQPIADSISSTATTVATIAFGVMATVLALKVGFGLVKSLISKAAS